MSTSDNPDLSPIEDTIKTSGDHKIALVVGSNNTKASSHLETLTYAEEDAYEVHRILRQDACGFNTLDPALVGEKATTGNVRSAIIRLVTERAEEDFLLFYFIGHAQPVKRKNGQSDIYLVTYDFNSDEVKVDSSAHLSLSWLRQILYQSDGAGKVLIILDCCYAGNFIEGSTEPYEVNIHLNLRKLIEEYFDGSHMAQHGRLRVVLTATGYNTSAQERVMTSSIVAVLQGKISTAVDDKGYVNIHTLYTYLQKQMPQEQFPNLSGAFPRTCILAYHPHFSELLRETARKAEENQLKVEVSKLTDQVSEMSKLITDSHFFEGRAAAHSKADVQYFDHTISLGASLADLHLENITDFFKMDRVQRQDDFLPNVSQQNQLEHFGLLQDMHPTSGALLCFGLNPTKLVPGAFIRCTLWRGGNRLSGWWDVQDYRENLIKQFELSRAFLRKHLRLIRVIRRDERSEELEIPVTAQGD